MMNKRIIFAQFAAVVLLFSCNAFSGKQADNKTGEPNTGMIAPIVPVNYGPLDTAVFAVGCFWCQEGVFETLTGVKEVVSGYSGGHVKNPTYQEVSAETTGHTETVEIYFDPIMISYQTLLEVYFEAQDPTDVYGGGPDRADSYRSVIFYRNETQHRLAEDYKKQLNESGRYNKPIAVTIQPFEVFYKAEEYHQDYEKKHPNNGYIQNVSVPKINRVKQKFPQLIKKDGQH